MKLTKLKIKNILGIDDIEFDAGKFTTITGANSSGKSSIFKAIQNVFQGGHEANLVRKGEEKGEIVLVFDDGVTARKVVTEEKSVLAVSGHKNGKTYLDSISDITAINPISFLAGSESERLKILLESMTIELPESRLLELLNGERMPYGEPLEVLEKIRKNLYDKRTGENRMVAGTKANIIGLEATLPPRSEVKDFEAELGKVEGELEELRAKRSGAEAERNTETERKVQSYKDTRDAEIEAIREKYGALIEETKAAHSAGYAKTQMEYESASEPLKTKIAELKESIKTQAVTESTKKAIARAKSELASYEAESARLDKALEEIAQIKLDILAKTPFQGLEIKDGRIYINNIPFTQLNTAAQVAFTLKLAKLRTEGKELKLVCLDNMECLDEQTLTAFKTAAAKTDLQFIITRVGNGELEVQ
jgi:DNA repair exonuclease SbcCD ATPase subunit